MSRFLLVLPFLLLSALLGGCGRSAEDSPSPVVISGETMGTYYRVTVVVNSNDPTREELQISIEETLNHFNRLMSTYLADSEVSQFNQSNQTDWFPVSDETAYVVDSALQIFQQSNCAFDISVAPLVELWGFGKVKGRPEPPAAVEIEAALRHVGSDQIEVQFNPPALRKSDPKLQIDLSAIAKGYAVDQVVEHLHLLGIENCLVDIGGELRAAGCKPGNEPWIAGIESPVPSNRGIQRSLTLTNLALATSGDYRNFLEFNGKRHSHEIDPRTGYPVENSIVSVSVIAENCIIADAWATALIILPLEIGHAIANKFGIAALFIVKDGDSLIEVESSMFATVAEDS